MTVAILITTHGHAAEALRKTAEMIVGKQQNLVCLGFVPGENGELLLEKMRKAMTALDTRRGLLVFIDLWGGTPFHAASALAGEYGCSDIVSGVNVPMLVETLMNREDSDNLEQLVQTALASGREGIRALCGVADTNGTRTIEQAQSAPEVSTQEHAPDDPEIQALRKVASQKVTDGPHMTLGLLRIDDRLIHGQVATRWVKETGVTRIIVVNDRVAEDKMRTNMLKQAVPSGVRAHTVSVDKMVRVYNNPDYANEKVMLLFTNPGDVYKLHMRGLPIETVNIGGIAFKEGRTMLDMSVSVDQEDVRAFEALDQQGVELEVRQVASDNKVRLMDLLQKKYYPMHQHQ